jgi:hypothetical protein
MAGGERGGGRAEYPVVRNGTSLATCGGGSVRWMGQISSWLGVADSTLAAKDVLARLAKRGIRVGRSASEAGGEGFAKVDTTAVAWYCFVAVRRSRPESAACLTVSSGFDPLSTAGGIGRPTVAATVDSSIAACSCRNADTYCHNYDCAINAGMPWSQSKADRFSEPKQASVTPVPRNGHRSTTLGRQRQQEQAPAEVIAAEAVAEAAVTAATCNSRLQPVIAPRARAPSLPRCVAIRALG